MIYLQLFWSFLQIGLFSFGGGYAAIPLIQGQIVDRHGWLSMPEFTDLATISQMTPGPIGINCATYVGYDVVVKAGGSHLLGIIGSFTATAAIVLPSFIIVLALARFYMKFRNNAFFDGVMSWLRPAVPGLIGAAAIILMFDTEWAGLPGFSAFDISIVKENFPDWTSWALFGAALIASLKFKIGPIPIILAGGVAGLLQY